LKTYESDAPELALSLERLISMASKTGNLKFVASELRTERRKGAVFCEKAV
jgi:hypothetical protein